jgi:hypothetical protein
MAVPGKESTMLTPEQIVQLEADGGVGALLRFRAAPAPIMA